MEPSITKRLKLMLFTTRPTPPNDFSIDLDNGCIVLSPKVFHQQIDELDWVRIRLDLNQSSSRVVQVIFNDLIEQDDVCYISPLLWYNLRCQPHQGTLEQVFWQYPLEQPDAMIMIEKLNCVDDLQQAQNIQLNLINSPDYPLDYDYTVMLHSYFDNHIRTIRVNDTISVPAHSDPLFTWSNALHIANSSTESGSTVIYFQICQINDSSSALNADYIVQSKVKLFKSSNINCCVPSVLSTYYQQANESLSAQPALRPEVIALSNLIRPYLLRIKSLHTGTFLVSDPSGCGSARIIRSVAHFWHLHTFELSAIDLLCEVPQTTETKFKNAFAKANLYSPCIVLIRHIDILYKSEIFRNARTLNLLRNQIAELNREGKVWPIILVATVRQIDAHHPLTGLFLHKFPLEPCNEQTRQQILNNLVCEKIFNGDVQPDRQQLAVQEWTKLTAGFSIEHLETIIADAVKSVILNQGQDQDLFTLFADRLKAKAERFREHNLDAGGGLLQVPNVTWSDIGGLEDVKRDILETIEMPLKLGLRFSTLGIRRSGILLHGPPGTGKTLLAKAVAAQCGLNFISVKGPELINKYVGQSEENVRALFAQARHSSPAIIFFDELDSLAPARGRSGDSGGVMDRVVSQLLTELDGISTSSSKCDQPEPMVFVIGATNRLDLRDSALLRPGRFDKVLHVPVATDRESRLAILSALTKRFDFDDHRTREDILLQVEPKCAPVMSGADFFSLCSSAMVNALKRTIEVVESRDIDQDNEEDGELYRIKVRLSDFTQVLQSN